MGQKIINDIIYAPRVESNAALIVIPDEGDTPQPESQEMINARSYELSTRNGANAYIVSTAKDIVYLNFIGQKIQVDDTAIAEVLESEFTYFIEEIIPDEDPFVISDGIFFRCVTSDSVPLAKEQYTYYIMMDGTAKEIPDYKTLEVMLAERGQNLLSVSVYEEDQCADLLSAGSGGGGSGGSSPIASKASVWTEDYADSTNLELLAELNESAKAAEELMNSAKEEADKQIATVKAQAEQAQAEAEAANQAAVAAQAQAAAAQTASQAAIAEANAAAAQAAAAEAAAAAAQAAAELAQAELEAEQNNLGS